MKYILAVVFLGLIAACGEHKNLDQKIDDFLNDPHLSAELAFKKAHKGKRGGKFMKMELDFLSTDAQRNFTVLKEKMTDLRMKKNELCGFKQGLDQETAKELDQIKYDGSLEKSAKKDKIKEILKAKHHGKKKLKGKYKECKANNIAELQEIKTSQKALLTACFPPSEAGRKDGPYLKALLKTLDDTTKQQQITQTLASTECSKALF